VNTVAVLGFKFSSSAMRDSVTLNNEGIIFMIPFASDWALTLKDFEYSFRIIPNALRVADWLTQFALTQAGYWSSLTNREVAVVILSPRNGFGYELERHFRKDAADWRLFSTTNSVTNTTTMRVVASKSYDPETTDFLPLVDKVLDDKFDAVLVTDTMPAAGQLIRQLRNMGVKKPILGGRGLDSSELLSIASNRAFRVYFPSKFVIPTKAAIAAMPTNLLIHSLMRRYADMYNSRPDFEAAQAYEGLHLLAEAFQRAATTSPAAVSSVLEHTGKWTGLLEVYSKFADHELVITNMFIKFAYPVGYPLTDLASYHEFVMESMTSSPFTNELEFAGYLSPAVTNKILNVDHFMHVPPHYPTGVY
jgi:ABC-type branched-subunit amino acid transport system substrate-binding protein